jgi:hypothetical protein
MSVVTAQSEVCLPMPRTFTHQKGYLLTCLEVASERKEWMTLTQSHLLKYLEEKPEVLMNGKKGFLSKTVLLPLILRVKKC